MHPRSTIFACGPPRTGKNMAVPATGAWTSWRKLGITANLHAGPNIIRADGNNRYKGRR
ncbi:hypothetical protein ACI2LF_12885 [Kribbella sp. NPDC020789]